MKLLSLKAARYRSLREETVPLTDLNLFIGTNASGKSTILDASAPLVTLLEWLLPFFAGALALPKCKRL